MTLTAIAGSTACRSAPPRTAIPGRRVEVQGHRGCRGLRPENTMAAFLHAIQLGVNVLELDLGLTRDGVLVVAHDPEVNERICTGADHLPARRLKDLSYAQLQTLDCGSKRNPRFPEQVPAPGERMPRLEQILELLRGHPGLGANIEIKTFPEHRDWTWSPERFARSIVRLVSGTALVNRITIQSFDPAALQVISRLDASLELSALAAYRHQMEPMLETTGARVLSPRHTALTQEDVSRYHRRGIRVIPWTVNEEDRMQELIGWGVDGIISDYPNRLVQILR